MHSVYQFQGKIASNKDIKLIKNIYFYLKIKIQKNIVFNIPLNIVQVGLIVFKVKNFQIWLTFGNSNVNDPLHIF